MKMRHCYLEIYIIDPAVTKNALTSIALRPFQTSNPAECGTASKACNF